MSIINTRLKIILVILSLVSFNCNKSSIVDKISSPNDKYQTILLSNKQSKNEISFQIVNTKTNRQVVLDESFFLEQLFETIDSDYPDREWLTKSVFAIGMFSSRQQAVQILKIENYSDSDIEFIRIAGFHNRIYVLDIVANQDIQVPFFTEQENYGSTAFLWIEVKFKNSTKIKKRFSISTLGVRWSSLSAHETLFASPCFIF